MYIIKTNKTFGVILVILGIIFAGNTFNIWDSNLFFDGWWTLFIIIPSLLGYFEKKWLSSTIKLLIGVILLLLCNGIALGSLLFPFILIVCGISSIFSKKVGIVKSTSKDYYAMFSSIENKVENKINDMVITSIFGSIDLDMETTKLEKNIIVDCMCLFGGINLKVPKNAIVTLNGSPIFGSIENKTKSVKNEKIITINVTCIFGSVEIN